MHGEYICSVCGITFDDDSGGEELNHHNEVEPSYTERFLVCPACGSSIYEDAFHCYRCKRPFKHYELRGGYYCDECLEEITNRYLERKFIKSEIDCYAEWLYSERKKSNADDDKSYI